MGSNQRRSDVMGDESAIQCRLKSYRQAKGWSQDQLAAKLKTTAPNVSRWENNHSLPSAETLKELGKVFAVSIDYLLYDETPLKPLVGFKDPELLEQFNQIDQLDDTARAAMKRFIKSLTAEKKFLDLAEQSR